MIDYENSLSTKLKKANALPPDNERDYLS